MAWLTLGEGTKENQQLIEQLERSLSPGCLAELALDITAIGGDKTKEQVAAKINEELLLGGRLPWPDRTYIAAYSWLTGRVMIRWVVPDSDANANTDVATRAAGPVVVGLIIVTALAVMGIMFWQIKKWTLKAGQTQADTPGIIDIIKDSSMVSKVTVSAVVIAVGYYAWNRLMRPKGHNR